MPSVLIGGNMRIIDNLSHTQRLGLVSAATQYIKAEQHHGQHPQSHRLEYLCRAREAFYKTLHQAVKTSTPDASMVPALESGFADYYRTHIASHRVHKTGNIAICNAAELERDAMCKARDNMRGGIMSF